MPEYVDQYMGVTDKQPYIRHAHEVYRLVAGLPHPAGDRAHALALHHARQIVSFYEHYDLPINDQNIYRDAHAAQNLRWWRQWTGDKVAWWAAGAHTANAPDLRIAVPPGPDWRYPTAGSYLRRWYGHRYRSIGFTFDHGTVGLAPAETFAMPPAAADWFEHPFAGIGHDQFAVDLRAPVPPPVRRCPVQFDELRRYVADVAPVRRDELEAHLAPIDWRGDPFAQLGWYTQLTAAEQRRVIAHAGAVDDLVHAVTGGRLGGQPCRRGAARARPARLLRGQRPRRGRPRPARPGRHRDHQPLAAAHRAPPDLQRRQRAHRRGPPPAGVLPRR
jgi:hypothetical protein